MIAAASHFIDDRTRGDLIRWTTSLLVVLGVYALGVVALMSWKVVVVTVELPPAAVMLDLEPLPPRPVVALPPPPPRIVEPPPIVAPAPAVALPPPKPRLKPVPPKPVEPEPQIQAAPQVEPTPPRAAPVQNPVVEPSPQVKASFAAQLFAHLQRYRHYPRLAQMRHQEGTVSLRFTMDRRGNVLAFGLKQGSGYDSLDQEALSMIKRAEPLPALPAEIPQAQIEFVIPITFGLR